MDRPAVAADIMTTDVLTLSPHMDVHEAIDRLLARRVSGAPVVDEEGRLLGILSEIDCINRLAEGAARRLPTTTVEHCMTQVVASVHEGTHLLSIVDIFRECRLRRLPVLRGGRLVGQIGRRDLLRALSSVLRQGPACRRGPAALYLSAFGDRGDAPV